MMRNHERIEELIAIRSICGLDPQEQAELEREMASHGFDCEECRRLETEYGEVAGRLAFALDPVAAAAGLRRRDDRARARRGTRVAARLEPEAAGARSSPWPRRWCCSSAARSSARPCSAARRCPQQATVLQLEPQDPALSGSVTAAFTPGERGIYLQGAGLETLPQDRVYELWVITGDTPAAAVCVRPGEDGSVFAFADSQVAPDDLLAVTVEPSTCSDAPTTPPIWVAPVTTA